MDNEGHVIGGHSYSHHFFFDLFSAKKMQEELMKTEKLVQRVIWKKIKDVPASVWSYQSIAGQGIAEDELPHYRMEPEIKRYRYP